MFVLADVNPYLEAPKWLSSGDTAWQLTAAAFVGMQSIPGLAILYAGLVKKKWALNSAVMCFYAFSIVLVCWSLLGYNMSFGKPAILGRDSFGARRHSACILAALRDRATVSRLLRPECRRCISPARR